MHFTNPQKPVGGVAVLPMADLMKATKKRAEKLALAEEEAAKKVSLDCVGRVPGVSHTTVKCVGHESLEGSFRVLT